MGEKTEWSGRKDPHPSDREWMTINEVGRTLGGTPAGVSYWEKTSPDFPARHTEGVPTRMLHGEEAPMVAFKARDIVDWGQKNGRAKPDRELSERSMPSYQGLGPQFSVNDNTSRMLHTWDTPKEKVPRVQGTPSVPQVNENPSVPPIGPRIPG